MLVPSAEGWSRARRSFPLSRGPAEGSVEGASSEAELSYFRGVGPLPSSEAETWCIAGGLCGEASSEAEVVPRVRGGPRMGRTVELGSGLSERWASWESGESLDVVGELQMLHGIRVQSDDGVVIIGGFFLSRSPSSSPSFPLDRRKIVGLGSV